MIMDCPMPKNKIIVVLLGLTQSGKSSTGNNILGQDIFQCGLSFVPTTRRTEYHHGKTVDGREILVIDTPPLLDHSDELTPQHVVKEIRKCMSIATSEDDGIDAIILTMNVNDRLTKEHDTSIKWLNYLFGEDNLAKYGVVLLTRKDHLDQENMTLDQFLSNTPSSLQDLIRSWNNRVISFDNKSRDEGVREGQVSGLVRMIDIMVAGNGKPCIVSEIDERVEQVIDLEYGCRIIERESTDGFIVYVFSSAYAGVCSGVCYLGSGFLSMWEYLYDRLW